MDEKEMMAKARKVYDTLCAAIEARGWNYEKEEERLGVHFGVNGDDYPMPFNMIVDPGTQMVVLASPMTFKMSEDKRVDGAIATCAATFGLADGSFDYDLSDGGIAFRMTASFRDAEIGEGLFHYMISCACYTVDKYNDKFLAIDRGLMSVSDFIAEE